MTYIALLEDYGTLGSNDRYETYAWKTGFQDRKEAWDWVVAKVSELWPDSDVIERVESWSKTDLNSSNPSIRAMDFAVQERDDSAFGLRLAITINDEDGYQNASLYSVPESTD